MVNVLIVALIALGGQTRQDIKRTAYELSSRHGTRCSRNVAQIRELKALLDLIEHESRYNPKAKNRHSSAYGLGQLLKSTRKRYGGSSGDSKEQLGAMMSYIDSHYSGKPSRALKHWEDEGWY